MAEYTGSKAISGIGTKFERWNESSSPEVWEELAEVYSITGPGKTRETIDVTSFSSTDGYREKIAGLRDAGTITFTMNFRRDTYTLINDDFESEDKKAYRIILADDEKTTLEIEGLVTELPLTIPEGDRLTVDVTIEISGKVNIYDWSSGA